MVLYSPIPPQPSILYSTYLYLLMLLLCLISLRCQQMTRLTTKYFEFQGLHQREPIDDAQTQREIQSRQWQSLPLVLSVDGHSISCTWCSTLQSSSPPSLDQLSAGRVKKQSCKVALDQSLKKKILNKKKRNCERTCGGTRDAVSDALTPTANRQMKTFFKFLSSLSIFLFTRVFLATLFNNFLSNLPPPPPLPPVDCSNLLFFFSNKSNQVTRTFLMVVRLTDF